MKKKSAATRPKVKLVHPSYQPKKEELREDMRVSAGFDEAVQALTQAVKIDYIRRPKARP